MTSDEYIASGILELYAAGGLSEAERRKVDEITASNPEVRAALQEMLQAMEAYASLHAVTPPENLKNKILNTISGQEETGRQEEALPGISKKADFNTVSRAGSGANAGSVNWLAAALWAALAVSAALNIYFYSNWQRAETSLSSALNYSEQLAGSFRLAEQKLSAADAALQALQHESTRTITLAGTPKAPGATVLVHWNPELKTVWVSLKNLPAAPTGKQYQLWALDNGKPIDAGVIPESPQNADLLQMKPIETAQAFAVTLEPRGGSVNPTLAEMYLMGSF